MQPQQTRQGAGGDFIKAVILPLSWTVVLNFVDVIDGSSQRVLTGVDVPVFRQMLLTLTGSQDSVNV